MESDKCDEKGHREFFQKSQSRKEPHWFSKSQAAVDINMDFLQGDTVVIIYVGGTIWLQQVLWFIAAMPHAKCVRVPVLWS